MPETRSTDFADTVIQLVDAFVESDAPAASGGNLTAPVRHSKQWRALIEIQIANLERQLHSEERTYDQSKTVLIGLGVIALITVGYGVIALSQGLDVTDFGAGVGVVFDGGAAVVVNTIRNDAKKAVADTNRAIAKLQASLA